MQSTRTRSQKTKVVPELTNRGEVAVRSKPDSAEVRPGSAPAMNAQERELRVSLAAYFRAEKRGFAPGGELQDWVEAEAEVLRLSGGA